MNHESTSDRVVVVCSEMGVVPVEAVFVASGEFVGEVSSG